MKMWDRWETTLFHMVFVFMAENFVISSQVIKFLTPLMSIEVEGVLSVTHPYI